MGLNLSATEFSVYDDGGEYEAKFTTEDDYLYLENFIFPQCTKIDVVIAKLEEIRDFVHEKLKLE